MKSDQPTTFGLQQAAHKIAERKRRELQLLEYVPPPRPRRTDPVVIVFRAMDDEPVQSDQRQAA